MQMDLFKSKEQITKEEGKVCKKCNVYLPLTAYAWRGNEGFQRTECKDCLRKIKDVLKGLHKITPQLLQIMFVLFAIKTQRL